MSHLVNTFGIERRLPHWRIPNFFTFSRSAMRHQSRFPSTGQATQCLTGPVCPVCRARQTGDSGWLKLLICGFLKPKKNMKKMRNLIQNRHGSSMLLFLHHFQVSNFSIGGCYFWCHPRIPNLRSPTML